MFSLRSCWFLCLVALIGSPVRASAAELSVESHHILNGPLGGFEATKFPLMAGPGIARVTLRSTEAKRSTVKLVARVIRLASPNEIAVTQGSAVPSSLEQQA